MISCKCGKEFCRECIERIKQDNKPCPMCNKSEFTFLRHYGSERYLNAQEVFCSRKKDGCEWKGKLKDYEQHLNESPAPDNQLDGCQFVEVECKHECGGWFQRRYIATHQDQECPERPYSCEHCDSTFKDVTDIHYAECPKYPVTCPNECRYDPFERQEIEDHLEDDCPLTKVSCPLHYAGCEVELPRKDMPEHMKDTVTHLALLANVTLSLTKENQELKEKQRATEEKQRATEEKQKKEVAVLKEETQQLGLSLRGFPIDFRVNYASEEEEDYLLSFYTHPHGYRMGIGKSTLINSLFYKKGGKYVPLADEGSLEPCTTEVNQYVLEIEGTTFNFYDSPGLQDNNYLIHLRLIQTTCPNIHLLIYCSKLDEPVRPAEFEALDNITKTFGMSVWYYCSYFC